MPRQFKDRIRFLPDLEIMDVDFSDLRFDSASTVDQVYDRIEELIAGSGDDKWYFLVNLQGTEIDSSAWMRYGYRGRHLNVDHSLGSVRFDACPETQAEIAARAGAEDFDANLCPDRQSALARIAYLRSVAPKRFKMKQRPKSQYTEAEIAARITLHHELDVMEADMSGMKFETLGDVHDFYDYIDHELRVIGRRWYFLVCYQNAVIADEVWPAFAGRGKKLNKDFSVGSVRYDTSEATAKEIMSRANTEAFDPNLCTSRDEALKRIADLRADLFAR